MSDPQDVPAVIAAAEQAAATGDLVGAESLLRVALQAQQAQLGAEHPDVASTLNNLAVVCEMTSKFDEAGLFYRRATELTLAALGPDHPLTVTSRDNLRAFQQARGEPEEPVNAAPETPIEPSIPTVAEPVVESVVTSVVESRIEPVVEPALAHAVQSAASTAVEAVKSVPVESLVQAAPSPHVAAERQGTTSQPHKHRGSKRRGRKQQQQKLQSPPKPQAPMAAAGPQPPVPRAPQPPVPAREAKRPADERLAAALPAGTATGTGRGFVVAALVVAVVLVAAAFWWWSGRSARAAGIDRPALYAEAPTGRCITRVSLRAPPAARPMRLSTRARITAWPPIRQTRGD
jgi:hypothetical protein